MTQNKAHLILDHAMEQFINQYKIDDGDISILHVFKSPDCLESINFLCDYYSEKESANGYDINEMYSDLTDPRDILSTVEYISDRYGCAGRIKFLRRIITE